MKRLLCLTAALLVGVAPHGAWAGGIRPPPVAAPDVRLVDSDLPQVLAPSRFAGPSAKGQVSIPQAAAPVAPAEAPGAVDRAGTGFFIGPDGTLLTASHVVEDCNRLQIVSKYVPRTWVSLLALDRAHDVALLRSIDQIATNFVRLAASAPVSARLLVLGYPVNAGLTDPAESWVALQNQNFPPRIGPLANPRAMLWMSAPLVTYGFSGGPIFDPTLEAVVGIVKGQVDGGYLRLIRDMPTSGIVIGPGMGDIGSFLKEEARYTPASAGGAGGGEAGLAMVKRATVHVLCWK